MIMPARYSPSHVQSVGRREGADCVRAITDRDVGNLGPHFTYRIARSKGSLPTWSLDKSKALPDIDRRNNIWPRP